MVVAAYRVQGKQAGQRRRPNAQRWRCTVPIRQLWHELCTRVKRMRRCSCRRAERPKDPVLLLLRGPAPFFCVRYSSQNFFDKFSETSKAIDGYDNSIVYTDYVLGEAFRMAEKASVDAVVFFSDHG